MSVAQKRPAPIWRRRLVRLLILFLLFLDILLVGLYCATRPRPNQNALAVGAKAVAGAADAIEIELNPPVDLDFMSRADVLKLRRSEVQRYADLLAAPYDPSDDVFAQIEDQRPWWGIAGEYFYGPGEKSIVGASEESRFILNPYLLVAADFWGSSDPSTPSLWDWDTSRIGQADLDRPDFPFVCQPEGLRWRPRAAQSEVTYDVTRCLTQISRWAKYSYTVADVVFDITAYNARDLNLNYIQLVQAESSQIKLNTPFDQPIAEPEFLHRGGSCQYPGGCNNASPRVEQFDQLSIVQLPAQLIAHLWRDRPASSKQPPDVTFAIHFK